jgi:ATP-dependent DNA helicase RecG
MRESAQELLERIRLGEDSFLELKEVRMSGARVTAPDRGDLADVLAAFANTRGGVCVLGVHDKTREVLGIALEDLDRVETFIRGVCNDSIEPPLPVVVQRLTLPTSAGEEAPVIRIDVDRSLFVHRSPHGYFHRVGSSTRKMSTAYLMRLGQQRSQAGLIGFDEQLVPTATLEDLDERLWRRFETALTAEDPREVFLNKLGMAGKDEAGAWRPTIAGVLMACGDPRRFLPNAFIQAVAYRGKELGDIPPGGVYQLDAAEISGPLDAQVVEACRFVARNMRTYAVKDIGRTDIPQYDSAAIFEAMVNAVAHRDYSIYGSKIRLRMFADRLELFTPGALANTMTVETLAARQSSRNEVVTSLLARCKVPKDVPWLKTERLTMMDRRGEGVPIILRQSEKLSGRRPKYLLIDGEELKLTIYAANPLGAEE